MIQNVELYLKAARENIKTVKTFPRHIARKSYIERAELLVQYAEKALENHRISNALYNDEDLQKVHLRYGAR
jgi:hypothetical protein